MTVYTNLTEASQARQVEYGHGAVAKVPLSFRVAEFNGECGELSYATSDDLADELGDCLITLDLLVHDLKPHLVRSLDVLGVYTPWPGKTDSLTMLQNASYLCNVVKKVERAALGYAGSRLEPGALDRAVCDMVRILHTIARQNSIDINWAVARKFNATSKNLGMSTELDLPPRAEYHIKDTLGSGDEHHDDPLVPENVGDRLMSSKPDAATLGHIMNRLRGSVADTDIGSTLMALSSYVPVEGETIDSFLDRVIIPKAKATPTPHINWPLDGVSNEALDARVYAAQGHPKTPTGRFPTEPEEQVFKTRLHIPDDQMTRVREALESVIPEGYTLLGVEKYSDTGEHLGTFKDLDELLASIASETPLPDADPERAPDMDDEEWTNFLDYMADTYRAIDMPDLADKVIRAMNWEGNEPIWPDVDFGKVVGVMMDFQTRMMQDTKAAIERADEAGVDMLAETIRWIAAHGGQREADKYVAHMDAYAAKRGK